MITAYARIRRIFRLAYLDYLTSGSSAETTSMDRRSGFFSNLLNHLLSEALHNDGDLSS